MAIPTAIKMYKNTHTGKDAKTLKTTPLSCDIVNRIPWILSKTTLLKI